MKSAIVTGASRGIGKAIALALATTGYKVVGCYEKSANLAKKLEKKSLNIKMIQADVANENDIKNLISFTIDKNGGIDVVIHNAGINKAGYIENYLLEDWNRMMDVNLTAKFLLSKYAIPYLKKSEDGNIISISSRGGLKEHVFTEYIPYCVNNAGTNNFTFALSKELEKDNIRVNAIIPTVTDTDRFQEAFTKEEQKEVIDSNMLGTSEEVAELVLKILGDKQINGELVIDKRVLL